MKTFNKRGDSGQTSLLFGSRVSKCDLRCEAYGAVDEGVSALGLARQSCQPGVRDILLSLQRELFLVGAELATPPEDRQKLEAKGSYVSPEMVQRLEGLIEQFEAEVEMPKAFVIPGASPGSAALHLARAVMRRAERRAVGLKEAGLIHNEEILRYLNRLSDLLFTLAWHDECSDEAGDTQTAPTR